MVWVLGSWGAGLSSQVVDIMSCYCEKQETLGDKTNLVWLKKGKGQVVLFAFSPLFRASTQAAYKLLFNALLLQKIT